MRDVVVYREPKLKPLPPSVVAYEREKGVTLPTRLEHARKAIAACSDLSELLDWKDKAAAIAAAAKAAKMPDLAKGANRVCKEALLRLGQLLLQYSGAHTTIANGKRGGCVPSPRRQVASAAGIRKPVMTQATRFASAPRDVIERVLSDDRIPANIEPIGRACPPQPNRGSRGAHMTTRRASDEYNQIMRGRNSFGGMDGSGLHRAYAAVKPVDVRKVRSLTPDEKKLVRAKVTEIMELLDAIDEACK